MNKIVFKLTNLGINNTKSSIKGKKNFKENKTIAKKKRKIIHK